MFAYNGNIRKMMHFGYLTALNFSTKLGTFLSSLFSTSSKSFGSPISLIFNSKN